MGEFSYMCKKCGCAIVSGSACIFALMIKGKIVEIQKGFNTNYGTVSEGITDEGIEWKYASWHDLVDIHFEEDKTSGFVAIHQTCLEDLYDEGKEYWKPKTRSLDDPNQGWGQVRNHFKNSGTEINLCSCQKILFNKEVCEDVKCIAKHIAGKI